MTAKNNYRIPTAEEILSLDDLPEEIVPIPEWGEGVAVRVRGMTVADRVKFGKDTKGEDGETDVERATVLAVVLGCVEPKFTLEQYEQLRLKSAAALDRIAKVWLRLSGIGIKELLEVRGNS